MRTKGKRGIEKQPFQLPDFIAATGIEKIRQAYIEKENSKKLKQKQRERMQPKMGKMDIDYQEEPVDKTKHWGDLEEEEKEEEEEEEEEEEQMAEEELEDGIQSVDSLSR
ncbi:uncharacterized protein LOC131013947 isoform X2 [Salvia miltiorrhiza]|uniref:uncharacterized protein LOC131013947 isoform X2 n=1 Tax=Salvia miltiorrhiza TaxID=226208 RepID=UPI0025ABFE9D|nr:uncharacterized protein LOC131013947 isoform X2 [Salvia miltiorrhiza]XP_057797866.1 uncharacterized protein LOC131013947 isoform X2 [Salvia miltiorrhiza]XP_057797867.1 uncharacterized protein LOC131013947 isoform X2 [Salvia miltiorrhiza]XP_057797868.1 uncharacterized protein LOC131013947 isoform X2 [Salvia miltiorrhiza]XP_057797869.1 uncharacterized protein LOC131013947 isoform X2 [Salvia miltiorrhiza]XP_057797870.1 uncharacterized protein LOC131013947 isoform X2 [Salvia miltiorrhiza]